MTLLMPQNLIFFTIHTSSLKFDSSQPKPDLLHTHKKTKGASYLNVLIIYNIKNKLSKTDSCLFHSSTNDPSPIHTGNKPTE